MSGKWISKNEKKQCKKFKKFSDSESKIKGVAQRFRILQALRMVPFLSTFVERQDYFSVLKTDEDYQYNKYEGIVCSL